MNIKKLAITAAAGAVMLSAAVVPAFAGGHHNQPSNDVSVTNNGDIKNTSVNVANTGLNQVNGGHSHHNSNGGSIKTGDAEAVQLTGNAIVTTANSCGCDSEGKNKTTVKNTGDIKNLSVNVANTGANQVNGGGKVTTGGAFAGQGVVNVVNTSVN